METPVPGTATADAVVNHILGMLPPLADLTDPTVTDMGPEVSCPAVFLRIVVERARMATILPREAALTCMRIFVAELDAEVSRVQGAGQVRQ